MADRQAPQARRVLSAFDGQARPGLVAGSVSPAGPYLWPILAFLAILPEGAALLVDYPVLVGRLNAQAGTCGPPELEA